MEPASIRLGNYTTLIELASGGMGTLYLARHAGAAGFERLVVVKRVHRHLLKSREFSDMFRDEARLASLIRHPNVVSVDDVVEADGELFLVCPYIESVTLADALADSKATGNPAPPGVDARILGDTLSGLQGAHEAVDMRGHALDVVHRDVSPQNILVGADGRSRLIDFGIAKARARSVVTSSGVMKGKLAYMAPEQFRRQALDARADLFAAGVVLYEALTGVRPFDGADEGDTLLSILVAEPPPPSTVAEGVPPAIDAVVDKVLSRDRDDRYPTAAAFLEALEAAIPLASAKDVAQWVDRCSGAEIEERRRIIRAILDKTAASDPAPAPAASDEVASEKIASTPAIETTPIARSPARRYATLLAIAVPTVALAGVLLARHPAEPAPAAAVVESSTSAPALKPEIAPEIVPTPSASATASSPVVAPSASARAVVRVPASASAKKPSELHDSPYEKHQ